MTYFILESKKTRPIVHKEKEDQLKGGRKGVWSSLPPCPTHDSSERWQQESSLWRSFIFQPLFSRLQWQGQTDILLWETNRVRLCCSQITLTSVTREKEPGGAARPTLPRRNWRLIYRWWRLLNGYIIQKYGCGRVLRCSIRFIGIYVLFFYGIPFASKSNPATEAKMNPGDVYQPPQGYNAYGSPTRQNQRPPQPQPPHLPPQQPPYPPPHQPAVQYGDPFSASPQRPPTAPVQNMSPAWQEPQGSHHHAAHPLQQASPTGPQSPRYSLPTQSMSPFNGSPASAPAPAPYIMGSPSHAHAPPIPASSPQHTRFNMNPSYPLPQQQLTPSYSYPNGIDDRLTSPPPLMPHHSSHSSISAIPAPVPDNINYSPSYPPQGYGNTADDDMNDSHPLLAHAAPDPRFGIPQSASAMSMSAPAARYQLSDTGAGDMGVPMYTGNGDAEGQNGFGTGDNVGADDENEVNMHYGPIPARMVRRNRTQKRVQWVGCSSRTSSS